MNHIYKSQYNASLGTWVAVPEIAKGHGKTSSVVSAIQQAIHEFSFRWALLPMTIFLALSGQAMAAGADSVVCASTGMGSVTQTSDGVGSVACGNQSKALKTNDIAVGYLANASGGNGDSRQSATSIGAYSYTKGAQAVALGSRARAEVAQAVALGNDTRAIGVGSVSIGGDDSSEGSSGTTYSSANYGDIKRYIPNGGSYHPTFSAGNGSTAIAVHAQALTDGSTAIGVGATAGDGTMGAVTDDSESKLKMGVWTKGTSIEATAIGTLSVATGNRSTAIGARAKATGSSSSAIGDTAQAKGSNSSAIGNNAQAEGNFSSAIGHNAQSKGASSVALGSTAMAQASSSIALGDGATISADNTGWYVGQTTNTGQSGESKESIAIGKGANIGKGSPNAIAIGTGAKVNYYTGSAFQDIAGSLAIGYNAEVNAGTSYTNDRLKHGTYGGATAIGHNAKTANGAAVALGSARANAINSIAIGAYGNTSVGNYYAETRSDGSFAVGNQAIVDTNAAGAQAIGRGATVIKGSGGAVALGQSAVAQGLGAVAIGGSSEETSSSALPRNNSAMAGAQYALALSADSRVSSGSEAGIAIGYESRVGEGDAVSDGTNGSGVPTSITGTQTAQNAIAIGRKATALSDSSIAIGKNALTGSGANKQAIAIGEGAQATGLQSISIGTGNQVSGNYAGAIGDPSIIAGSGSYSMGNDNAIGSSTAGAFIVGSNNQIGAKATYDNTGKLQTTSGLTTFSNASNSAVVGNRNYINSQDTYVLGSGINTNNNATNLQTLGNTVANSVYLGSRSTATAGSGSVDAVTNQGTLFNLNQDGTNANTTTAGDKGTVDTATINGITYTGFAGVTANGVVTVGAAGSERRIQNVAAGEISATSTDAVNGSQLFAFVKGLSSTPSTTTSNTYFHVNDGTGTQGIGDEITNLGAIDDMAGATGNNSITAGVGAQAYFEDAMALGTGAKAQGEQAIAVGTRAKSAYYSTALGVEAEATVGKSTAVGYQAKSSHNSATALGYKAESSASLATALGASAKASADGSTAIGSESKAAGQNSVAVGYQAKATDQFATALGGLAEAQGVASTAFGYNANAQAYGTAVGQNATASGTETTALGSNAQATSALAMAAGNSAEASGEKSTAVGASAQAIGGETTAVGQGAIATGNFSTAFGTGVRAEGSSSLALGGASGTQYTTAAGASSMALGHGAKTWDTATFSQAIGDIASVEAANSVALGTASQITGNAAFSTAVGASAQSHSENGTAMGYGATVHYNAANSVALGTKALAGQNAGNSTVVGFEAKSTAQSGTVLGYQTNVSAEGGVALGSGSVANRAGFTSSEIAPFSNQDLNGITTGAVSVGTANTLRQIINVGDGTEDTDAVNLRQLKGVQQAATAAKTEVVQGNNISVSSSNGSNGQTIYTVATATDVNFDKVTVGGITLNSGTDKISGLAKGDVSTASSDAVNGSQLYAQGAGVQNIIGGNTTYNPATGTYDNKDIGGTGESTIDAAIRTLNTNITNVGAASKENVISSNKTVTVTESTNRTTGAKTFDLGINTGSSLTVDPTTGVMNINTDGTTITTDPTTGAIKVNTAPLTNTNGSVNTPTNPNALATAGDVANAINHSGFTLTAQGKDGSVVNPGETVNMNNTDGNITITKSTTSNDVTYNLAKDIKVDSVKAGDTTVNNDGITINNASGSPVSLTKDGLNNGGNRITNVAAGVDANDAVNMSQLKAISGNTATMINILDNRITNVDNRVTNVNNRVTNVRNELRGIIGTDSGGNIRYEGLNTYNMSNQSVTQHRDVISAIETINKEGTKFFHTNETGNQYAVGSTNDSSAGALNSTAIGVQARVSPEAINSLALGAHASVEMGRIDSVALGAGSVVSNSEIDPNNPGKMRARRSLSEETPYVPAGTPLNQIAGQGQEVVGEVSVGREARWVANVQADGSIDANEPVRYEPAQNRRVSNVAAGYRDTDAVNVSQLRALDNRVSNVEERANAGTASALATATVPMVYRPGATMIGAGAAVYGGQSALAVGFSSMSDNGRWVIKGTATANAKNVGAALGVGYQW